MEDEPLDQRMQIVISRGLLAAVDDWRRRQETIPSRSEAVRRLVELGLGTSKSNESKGKSKVRAI